MLTITAAVVKGGTAKTTTCLSLAQAAAFSGRKVLCIDLDPQANLSFALGADINAPGAYHLLHGMPITETIQQTAQGIDLIASSPDLATERSRPASAKRLQTALMGISSAYDLCLIDVPPTAGELQFNALQAAQKLIIPLRADAYSLQGLYQITDLAKQIQTSNPDLQIAGVVITQYDGRSNIARFMRDAISDKGNELGAPLIMVIRSGIAIQEAAAMQESLYEIAPQSNPATDYAELLEKIWRA